MAMKNLISGLAAIAVATSLNAAPAKDLLERELDLRLGYVEIKFLGNINESYAKEITANLKTSLNSSEENLKRIMTAKYSKLY